MPRNAEGTTAASAPRAKPRALVVDDDAAVAMLWETALQTDGWVVARAGSAPEVAGRLGESLPDVILLDLGLPNRSGASLLVELKADAITAAIPVVVISGAPEGLPPDCIHLPYAILRKPVRIDLLRTRLWEAVRGRGT